MQFLQKCRVYSVPLILGVVLAVIWANLSPETYETIIYTPFLGPINVHLLINDVFMLFFFASAGVEIVNSISPGGALNPVKKAVTPLLATCGGVLGPIAMFFIFNNLFGSPEYSNGWGICTATDIALSWLVAKMVFGKKHPAVSFLLLLAVVDDAIGLVIIALFYPDPTAPTMPIWLLLVAAGMLIAFLLRKKNVQNWVPYIFGAGTIAWIGMYNAHLHPALALVFIVPFLPRTGKVIPNLDTRGLNDAVGDSPLQQFEKKVSPFVDYGLILFGLANAGVSFSNVTNLTWIICLSLILGKTIGISLFTYIATLLKFKLPENMTARDVITAGVVGGMGLTVALFVAGSAYTDVAVQGAAKMGALFTAGSSIIALIVGKALRVKKIK